MKFDPAQILLMIPPVLLAITMSEAARAYAARYWGDNTAEKFGRLSLNPFVHIDLFSIAAAGLLANLLMMYAWGLLLALLPVIPAAFREPFSGMAGYGITFNAVLFVLNALPVLPFDGGRIIDTFLPAKYSVQFQKTARYGTWVVLILLLTGILGYLILPLAAALSYTAYLPATLIAALFLR